MLSPSPIVAKELRTLLRSPKAFWLAWLAVGLLGALFAALWSDMDTNFRFKARATVAREVFMWICWGQLGALGIAGPLVTALAVAGERENRTLELLYCSGLPRAAIVFGKWFSSIAFGLLVFVCMGPVLALVFMLGGVAADEYLFMALVIVSSLMTFSMLGLAISCYMRRTIPALMLTLFIVGFLSVLLPFGTALFVQALRLQVGFDPLNMTSWSPAYLPFLVSPVMVIADYGFSNRTSTGSLLGNLTQNRLYVAFFASQAFIFALSAGLAWRRLARGETTRPVVAKPPIDDEALLRKRRRTFPYYLIDPLRRPHRIADNRNPVAVKEQRSGAFVRLNTLIRIAYCGALFSIALMPIGITARGYSHVTSINFVAFTFTLFFLPVLCASAINREFEEGTIDLLAATPLTNWQIVFPKFLVGLRVMACVMFSVLLLPCLSFYVFNDERFTWFEFTGLMVLQWPGLLAYLAVFCALSLFCSAVFKRTATAVIGSYSLIAICLLAPVFNEALFIEILGVGYHESSPWSWFHRHVVALVSPFYFYTGDNVQPFTVPHAYGLVAGPLIVAFHAAVLALAAWGLLRLTCNRLRARFAAT